MSHGRQSTDSVAQRSLGLRARGDLEYFPQDVRTGRYWVVKDPVSLRYFQLREEEYAVLRGLDGRASLDEITNRFEARFAPTRLTEAQLHQFLGTMHDLGLVISDHPGQAAPLMARQRRRRRQELLGAVGNVLAIRLPGVDPDPFLRRTYPLAAWFFSPWCVVVCVLLMISALLTVLVQWDAATARLPEFEAFFGPANLPWLILCLAAVKVLHELGHAMTCRHFGCECHEIGVLFLVFTPLA